MHILIWIRKNDRKLGDLKLNPNKESSETRPSIVESMKIIGTPPKNAGFLRMRSKGPSKMAL